MSYQRVQNIEYVNTISLIGGTFMVDHTANSQATVLSPRDVYGRHFIDKQTVDGDMHDFMTNYNPKFSMTIIFIAI